MTPNAPPLGAADVHAHVRDRWAAPCSGPARVGVEQEWHTYHRHDPARRCTPDEVLAASPSLPGGSRVTVEPGGQVELATPPTAPWWEAADVLAADARALRAGLDDAGIVTVASGVDPFRQPVRTLHQPRYDAMERYFDRWGPAGRRMMCGTAAIQHNIDLGTGDEPAQRWRTAHTIGPAVAAAFATSPRSKLRCERLAIWGQLDPSRTAPALATGDPVQDWTDYVLSARLLLVQDGNGCRPVDESRSFREWVSVDSGAGPRVSDLDYHVTTLFPPVRLRGWLELRWMDSVPAPHAAVAVAATSALLTDPIAREEAEAACAPVADAWDRAAHRGPTDPSLSAAAVASLGAAAEALDRVGDHGGAEATERFAACYPAQGRSPGDDLVASLAEGAGPVELSEAEPWR